MKNDLFLDLKSLNQDDIKILNQKFRLFQNRLTILLTNSPLFKKIKNVDSAFNRSKLSYVSRNLINNYYSMTIDFYNYNSQIKPEWTDFKIWFRLKPEPPLKSPKDFFYSPISIWHNTDENKYELLYTPKLKCYNENLLQYKREDILITDDEFIILKSIHSVLKDILSEVRIESKKLLSDIKIYLKLIDQNEDGKVDLINNELFDSLLKFNQDKIIQIDRKYIQEFVKISSFLKSKKHNIQVLFESIRLISNKNELIELINLLNSQKYSFDLLLFNSLCMITSLVENDLITFYYIYEKFEELGIFKSTWEKEISKKLSIINSSLITINENLKDILYAIHEMESSIISSIEDLNNNIEDSLYNLNNLLDNQLEKINSSIKFNNLVSIINTYQNYKINRNTRSPSS